MSSVPAGKRSWKCPECGSEVLLSMTQLDPIACETCLAKMKGGGKSGAGQGIADAVAGPLGIWQALPETTKLAIVVAALAIGLVIGYVAGKATSESMNSSSRTTRTKDSPHSKNSTPANDSTSDSVLEERPDPPGPGYKWVKGCIHKDGTRGDGHWAKDPHYKGDDESSPK